MEDIKAAQEVEYNYNINVEHYVNNLGKQRVKRTLTIDGEIIASEDFDSNSQEGSLRLFTGWIDNAYIQETSRDVKIIREPRQCNNLLMGFATVLLAIITILLTLALWILMS